MKQTGIIRYTVTLKVKTGLHIGGSASLVQIGGIDNPIVKNHDGYPYIPGSSLKGKLRSLYELAKGKVGDADDAGGIHTACEDVDCEICRFFGVTYSQKKQKREEQEKRAIPFGPTRFLFRDLTLTENSVKDPGEYGYEAFRDMRSDGINPLEEKMEVAIDRFSGTAQSSGPRPLERVPAGTVFTGELLVRLFESGVGGKTDEIIRNDTFGEKLDTLKNLLDQDYLGGMGSRGSGQVEITFGDPQVTTYP